jgi:hypothetical protein
MNVRHHQHRPAGFEQRRLDHQRGRAAPPGLGLPHHGKIEPARHAAERLGRAGQVRRQPARFRRNAGALGRLLEFLGRGLGGSLRFLVQFLDPRRRHLAGQHGGRNGVVGERDAGEMRIEQPRQRDRIVDRRIIAHTGRQIYQEVLYHRVLSPARPFLCGAKM